MTDSPEVVALIKDIERRDVRFRRSQTIFVVTLIIGLLVLLILMFQALAGISRQLTATEESRQSATAERENQLQVIEDRLNCIVRVFREEDRSDITIEDVDNCTIERDGESNNDASTTVVVPTSPAQTPVRPPSNPTPDQQAEERQDAAQCRESAVSFLGLSLLSLCK